MLNENIRKYRKKLKLSQKSLAELLFLTPQTISKWEKGLSEPRIQDLCRLSQILGVSTDELLDNKMSDRIVSAMIAVDGGGTKTEFVLFDKNGNIFNHTVLEGSNPNLKGVEHSVNVIKNGIDFLLADKIIDVEGIFIGIAGGFAGGKSNIKITKHLKELYPYTKIKVDSDITNVICSAADCTKCVSVICGTGFVVYAKNANGIHRLGGWGYYLDEAGSGFSLGKSALCAALAEREGTGIKTLITSLVENLLGATVWDKIDMIYSGGVEYIASFAKNVFEAYSAGDTVAAEILKKNMMYIASVIKHAREKYDIGDNIILAGGVVGNNHTEYAEMLMDAMKDDKINIIIPELPPIYGAAVNCCRIYSEMPLNFKENSFNFPNIEFGLENRLTGRTGAISFAYSRTKRRRRSPQAAVGVITLCLPKCISA